MNCGETYLLARALRGMLLDNGVFGDVTDGYRNALVAAYEHFLSWRKIWKVPCSQKRFTPGQLQREGYGFYLNCKGFNARVVTEWLCDVVIQNPTQDPRHNLVEVALML